MAAADRALGVAHRAGCLARGARGLFSDEPSRFSRDFARVEGEEDTDERVVRAVAMVHIDFVRGCRDNPDHARGEGRVGAYTYPSNGRVVSCVIGQLFFHPLELRMIVHPLRQVWYGPR